MCMPSRSFGTLTCPGFHHYLRVSGLDCHAVDINIELQKLLNAARFVTSCEPESHRCPNCLVLHHARNSNEKACTTECIVDGLKPSVH